MPFYRVFPHRYFISVHWLDIEAPDAKKAGKVAIRAVKKLFSQEKARADAVDNHWSLDGEPLKIDALGTGAGRISPMEPVYEDANGKAFINQHDFNRMDLHIRSGWDTNNLILIHEKPLRETIDFLKGLINNINISVQVKGQAVELIAALLQDAE